MKNRSQTLSAFFCGIARSIGTLLVPEHAGHSACTCGCPVCEKVATLCCVSLGKAMAAV